MCWKYPAPEIGMLGHQSRPRLPRLVWIGISNGGQVGVRQLNAMVDHVAGHDTGITS